MKVGNYIMIVSGIICIGLNLLLCGCCGNCDQALRQLDERDKIETQEVSSDTVELARSVQFYPILSKIPSVVSLEKISPKAIKSDSPFDYDLTVTNLTDSTITNVIVSDTVPESMVFIESGYTLRRISDEQVQWEIGTLEPMASAVIKTTAVARGGGTILSCAEVSYECPVCAEIKVLKSQLSFSKEAPKEVLPCDRIEFKYKVTNNGMTAACDIVIEETLPEGLITGDGKKSFEFKFDSIEPGQVREFSKMIDSMTTGKYVSKAVLTSSNVKSVESNIVEINVAEPVLTLREVDSLELDFESGRVFEYLIVNDGAAIASNTMIMAMLPKGVELSSASDDGKILESDPRIVAWRIGELKPNASKRVTMVIDGGSEFVINPQVVAKATCAHAVAAMRIPRLKELTSVSLYKPFAPE
jgi:uncharacterized repeat protein (TIGR01451 family)